MTDHMGAKPLHDYTRETISAARVLELIIPSNVDLERPPRMIYVKRGGRIVIEDAEGNRISMYVYAHNWLPLSPVKVLKCWPAILYAAY